MHKKLTNTFPQCGLCEEDLIETRSPQWTGQSSKLLGYGNDKQNRQYTLLRNWCHHALKASFLKSSRNCHDFLQHFLIRELQTEYGVTHSCIMYLIFHSTYNVQQEHTKPISKVMQVRVNDWDLWIYHVVFISFQIWTYTKYSTLTLKVNKMVNRDSNSQNIHLLESRQFWSKVRWLVWAVSYTLCLKNTTLVWLSITLTYINQFLYCWQECYWDSRQSNYELLFRFT